MPDLRGSLEMLFVAGLLLSAALFGTILVVMEGEFPGWGPMIGCAFAVSFLGGLATWPLPAGTPAVFHHAIAALAGAAAGAVMLAWLCGLEFRRGVTIAGVYVAARIVLGVLLSLIT